MPGGGSTGGGVKMKDPETLSPAEKGSREPSVTVPAADRTVPEYSNRYSAEAEAVPRKDKAAQVRTTRRAFLIHIMFTQTRNPSPQVISHNY